MSSLIDDGRGALKTVDDVSERVAHLADGWASVIRCKAAEYGGAACRRIIMVVFRDFYQPSPEDNYAVWDSSRPMLCEDCATNLRLLQIGP
jgi:hypothetical protein